jgi:hypothetical protein
MKEKDIFNLYNIMIDKLYQIDFILATNAVMCEQITYFLLQLRWAMSSPCILFLSPRWLGTVLLSDALIEL